MTDGALLAVDDALDLVLGQVGPPVVETVALGDALDRYLAEPLVATLDLPPFTNSAMDGYAIRHRDAPGRFEVIGESAAGAPFAGAVGPGEAVTISTGAVVPDGADAVAPIEWVTPPAAVGDSGPAIRIDREVHPGYAVRRAGSDVARGEDVLAAGIRLGPGQIGAAASLGLGSLRCGRRPRVAVLTTGSELRAPGQRLGPGEIYDSNGPLLRAALAHAGAEVVVVATATDTHAAHRTAIEQALEHDVVLTTGGVSVGGHDLVREIERELGVRELFWRVAIKPGKPLSFGVREATPGERTLVFGIPGNPVSVLVCFELFVRPALAALQGASHPRPAVVPASLAVAVQRNPERDEMIRVRRHADGRIEPLRGQESHQLALSALSDGLARIPAGTGALPAGSPVGYLPLGVS
ncbi:MAG TPA: gephyrin-like molybdotransferase Glp [Solirubrobacteraceae bacterium]|nr:gephyrin-like molybdotransferase Glp [Solirubrobacteraceae bacterium]